MAHLLRMPEVAAGSDRAVLQDWSVAVDEAFPVDHPLATVETDKAVVEVEAEAAGVLLRTLVPAGATVAVGAPIAVVGDPGEDVADVDAVLARLGVESAEAETGEGHRSDSAAPPGADRSRLFISPLARRLAADSGLDASEVRGTGPKGRIRKRDVEAALEAREATPPAAESPPRPTPRAGDEGGDVPHTRLRRAVAARLTESKRTVPHFYVRGTADVGALVALREELNADAPVTVSVNDLLVKAVAVAHRRHPEMNVVWTEDAVRTFEHADIAVAVASRRGLVTPVVRAVDTLGLTDLAGTIRDLVGRADAGTLKQGELEGGTISVSNLGMLGVEEFSAIINPPHAAILSVGAIREEPVVRDGGLAVASVLHLVLSVDHRPVDGATAARWMRTLLSILERPVQILA